MLDIEHHLRRTLRELVVAEPAGLEEGLVRHEVEITIPCLLAWLQSQSSATCRFYWQSRDGSLEIATLGQTHEVKATSGDTLWPAWAEMQRLLAKADPRIRYVGGMAFDLGDHAPTSACAWDVMRFWIPRFELVRTGNRVVLALNRLAHDTETWEDDLARLEMGKRRAVVTSGSGHGWLGYCQPDQELWQQQVEALRGRLNGDLGKLVLACRQDIHLEAPLEACALLDAVRSKTSGAYNFLLEKEGVAFLGSSPECLYGRQDQQITTEALAGTQAVRATHASDLRHADKEGAEHDFVIRDVQQALEAVCSDIQVAAEKELLQWNHLLHLRTALAGTLRPDASDGSLVKALHPSAAVLGYPREEAWQALREIEGFARGWYAGPVGWLARDSAEFAVGIRSAVLCEQRLSVYAGAGIVKASDPTQEWQEIRTKMRPYLEFFGLAD